MKKIFLSLLFLALIYIPQIQTSVSALENSSVMNLKSGESYVIDLNARPQDILISNPRIVKADAVTDIMETDSSLIITTYEEGISYITFKLKDTTKTIKVLIDDKADEDNNLLKLDRVNESKD